MSVEENSTARVSKLKVSYQQNACSYLGTNCVGDVRITIDKVEIELHYDMTVTIDNTDYENVISQPYYDGKVLIKRVTSLFVIVKTHGFDILYDANGQIYITVEPHYSGMVRMYFI